MADDRFDVIILGTGPAGLQAAIHAVRAKVSVLVLGKQHKSSLYKAHIENFCCLSRIDGETLLKDGRGQAERFGARFLDEDAIAVTHESEWFSVRGEGGDIFQCRSLILALGISRNKLNVPGEKEFLGKGVSYCVDCDAAFYRNDSVAIVGSESAALTGALTLLFYASEVHLVCKSLDVTEALTLQIRQSPIRLYEGRRVKAIIGKTSVEGLLLDDDTHLHVRGVFIELGAKGAAELAGSLGVAMDPDSMKYIHTNKKQETNLPGVYAAGDICGPPWQVAVAVGQGAAAGLEAASFAKKFR